MNNSVWLAILAAIFYGFGGPFMKHVHQSGVSTRDFVFIASLTTLAAATFWPTGESLFSTFNNGKVVAAVLIASILLTAGFISLNQALANPMGLASMVLIISSANPLIGSLISLFFLGEAKKVSLPILITGSLLTIAGIVIVVLSARDR